MYTPEPSDPDNLKKARDEQYLTLQEWIDDYWRLTKREIFESILKSEIWLIRMAYILIVFVLFKWRFILLFIFGRMSVSEEQAMEAAVFLTIYKEAINTLE